MAESRRSRLPATVVALGVVSLLSDIGSEMVFPLLPAFLTHDLKAGTTFLGLIEGAAESVSSLLKLASGYAADHLPRRKPFVLFGYGIPAAVRPLLAIAGAPWQVLAIRVTDRIGKGTRTSPRDALLADAAVEGQSGRAFGFHQAMDDAGAVCGPLVATGLLALGLHVRSIFLWAAIPGALAFAVTFVVREKPAERRGGSAEKAKPIEPLPEPALFYFLILAIFAIGNSSDAFLLLQAGNVGLSPRTLPLLWSAFHVSKVVSSYLGGWASDHVGPLALIVSGWIIFAGVYLGLGFATHALEVWVLFIVYGLYYGLTTPTEKALLRSLVPEAARGRAFGIYNFVVGVSALPSGLLAGALWNAFGARVALGTGAALAVTSALALLVWSMRFRRFTRVRA